MLWSYAHPRAIELSAKIASLTPGDLNRVFFTSGGSEAVESAIKLARAYHQKTGNPRKTKFITREVAYHGTTLGALAATGIPRAAHPVRAARPRRQPRPEHEQLPLARRPPPALGGGDDRGEDRLRGPGDGRRGDPRAGPERRRLHPAAAGYFQAVREICDRHDVLLVSDEVICAWGRLGHWFGCQRYEYQPDLITTAKALTSAYAPMGALIASDRIAEPFMHGNESFVHGFTFGGHPVAAAVALANIDVFEREDLCGHVLAKQTEFRSMLEGLLDIPIVGDVRGDGFFQAIELVKDQDTKETFSDEESEWLLRGFLSGELYDRGLICRADDRGDPVDAAGAAAGLRHRAVRGDRVGAAGGADRGRRADLAGAGPG